MENEQMSFLGGVTEEKNKSKNQLDVVKADFIESQSMSWRELFDGFDAIKIITYSSGMEFVSKLLQLFDDAEIIYGSELVMSFNMQEIMAFQQKMIEKLATSKTKDYLISRIDNGSLSMYVSKTHTSHEKIYLLSSSDGRKRVVTGSANMSHQAFDGIQRENITYMDGDMAYDWYLSKYEEFKSECTNQISKKSLVVSTEIDAIEELPICRQVEVGKVLEIIPDNSCKEEIEFALDVRNLSNDYKICVPKEEPNSHITIVSPTKIKTMIHKIKKADEEKKIKRQEFPKLYIDTDNLRVTLNGTKLDLNPSKEEILNDVSLFLQYMDGYKDFNGEWKYMQYRYYEFANWFFCSPFMPEMRRYAKISGVDRSSYPIFGVVYGQSKAGKTTFLKTLIKMMIGQETYLVASDFTKTTIDGLRHDVEGAPIIVDDVMKSRFNTHAPELIKNEDFGFMENLTHYPSVVFSANSDMETIKAEYSRRAVCINVNAGLSNERLREKSTFINRLHKRLGTAFYREYLRRMLEFIPEQIAILKDENSEVIPDILNISSKIIYSILDEFSEGQLPDYVRILCYNDYFGSTVIGKQMIEKIRTAWEINKDCFMINEKANELTYDTANIYEAKKMRDELPEELETKVSRELIIMRLDKAKQIFRIRFKLSLLDKIKRKKN